LSLRLLSQEQGLIITPYYFHEQAQGEEELSG